MSSSSPFKWCHFEPAIILCGVRCYLRYACGIVNAFSGVGHK